MDSIEVIRELIPLLTSAGEGVFVIALMVVAEGYVASLLFFIGMFGTVLVGVRTIREMNKPAVAEEAFARALTLAAGKDPDDWKNTNIQRAVLQTMSVGQELYIQQRKDDDEARHDRHLQRLRAERDITRADSDPLSGIRQDISETRPNS